MAQKEKKSLSEGLVKKAIVTPRQLKQTQDTLANRGAELRTIVENNPDGLIVVSKDGAVLFFNEVAMFHLNRNKEELSGKPLGLPIDISKSTEIDIVRTGGGRGIAQVCAVEIEWEKKLAYLVMIHDITELKRLDQLKDEFLSTVSHELRTPLTTMKEFASIISDEIPGKLTKEQKEYVDIIKCNIDLLTRLINNLLDISKIESGKIEPKKALVDITDLANSVISLLKPEMERKHIEFETLFPQAALNVYADPDKVTQIFTNLIGNAVKFTPGKGRILIEIIDKDSEIECSVSDTGVGIASENLSKLFTKFQQFGRVPGAGAKGTGLGLAITKELVQRHNGRIRVESELGKGSKFIFTLPKYSKEVILYEAVETGITGAKKENKEFSIFIIRLDDYPEGEKEFEENRAQKVFLPISAALEKVMQSGDFVTGNNEIIAFAQVNKTEASGVIRQLKMVIKVPILEIEEQFKMGFSYGYATYPDDADNAKDLLEKAYQSCVREREERLKKAIMIVDDEPEARNIVRKILQASGYSNFSEAGNGEEAFEKIKTAIPDLLILDMRMPRMNGYELIGMLKENTETKDIPVLIMSGSAVEIDKLEEYIKKKAIPVVGKPLDTEQLIKLVNYLL